MTDREPAILLKVSEIINVVSRHADRYRMLKNKVCKKNIFKHLICHGTTLRLSSLSEKGQNKMVLKIALFYQQ